MTLRTKTLWYATKVDADVPDAVVTDLDQFTIYCENISRAFRSVQVWIGWQDIITLTGGTIGEHRCALRLGAGAYTTITDLDDVAHSGENMSGIFGPFDFTSVFAADFGVGVSQTCDIQVYFDQTTGTTLGVRNVNAIIAVTYEYDDSATTQYATAIIPMEGPINALPIVETELGTNQIPQLTGVGGLLENVSSVIVRQQFFVVEGNNGKNSITGFVLNIRIDAGTTKTFNASEQALSTSTFYRFIYLESPDPASAHAFKLWATGVASMHHCAVDMYVTYEFAVSGTTEFLNSILIPFEIDSPMGGTTANDASRFTRDFFVEEPTTITLKQSAIRLYYLPGAAAITGVLVKVGSQAYRTYTDAVAVVAGVLCLQQRIDSGSEQGAGITLARGKNTITIDIYRTDATDLGYNVSGAIILNYKSGVSASGIGAHVHTTVWGVFGWDALLSRHLVVTPSPPNIPETNWYAVGVGFVIVHWDNASYNAMSLACEINAGEGKGDGWEDIYRDVQLKDAERSCVVMFARGRDVFQRYPQDPDTSRLVLENSRRYRYINLSTCARGIAMLLTYHSITFTISGTVSGYTGDGSGILVEIHRSDTDEKVLLATTAVGGGYSTTWFDNTINMYAHARQDATHVGRSEEGVAT